MVWSRQPVKFRAACATLIGMDPKRLLAASVVCVRSLRANIREIAGPEGRARRVLIAGPRQLSSVWTRDFCFAADGLLAAGEAGVVRATLDEILAKPRADGLLPRLLDSYHPGMRLARAALGGLIPLRAPLIPNYRSEHGVCAADVNSLAVIAAARYARREENFAWAGSVLPALEAALAYYDRKSDARGFIRQKAFADWKDTVSRKGAVFFTQLLRWKAFSELAKLLDAMGKRSAGAHWSGLARENARRVHRAFWDSRGGFFRDSLERERLSSEGNLAAIVWGFADGEEGALILRAMDRAGLVTPWGPKAGEPYARSGKAALACLAGISGYHDEHVWLWNTALFLRALHKLERRSLLEKTTDSVCGLIERDGTIHEVYEPATGRPVRTWLFRAERPFSWSAAMLLEAFEKISSENRGAQAAGSPA